MFINSHAYYCYDFSSHLSNNLSITCNLINKKKTLLFISFKKKQLFKAGVGVVGGGMAFTILVEGFILFHKYAVRLYLFLTITSL